MDIDASKRQDLFKIIRITMYSAAMHPIHLEQHLPHYFHYLGIIIEMIYELFLYFVAIHIVILYICTIYLNYDEGNLELLVNCLMQTIIYIWTLSMKLYFRRLRPKKLFDIMDFINRKYKLRSAKGNLIMIFMLFHSNFLKFLRIYLCYHGRLLGYV